MSKKASEPEREIKRRGPKICRLTRRVGNEVGRIYRAMRQGKIETVDGWRMVQALLAMKSCLETAEIEKRLAAIEEALLSRDPYRAEVISIEFHKAMQ